MQKRIRDIRDGMDMLQEDLLAFLDDVWLRIDHNEADAVRRGADLQIALIQAVADLARVETQLLQLTEGLASRPAVDTLKAARGVGPHGLDKDFSHTRPSAFSLGGIRFDDMRTWKAVYATLCRHLSTIRPEVFGRLADDPMLVGRRGVRYFARDGAAFHVPCDFGRGVFAETCLSANGIRDNIKRLLPMFGFAERDFVVYLRTA